MATIRKRGDFSWEAQVRRRGYPPQSHTAMYREDAEKWARAVEAEMDRGVFVSRSESERMTLDDLIGRFETEFAPHHYRQREDNKEAWRFQCTNLRSALGKYSLAAIDQKVVAKYRDMRLKVVADSTVRKELYMLSKILGFGEIECGISLPRGNPVEKIRKPADSNGRDRRLTVEEWRSLEAECRASRNIYLWPACVLALETAMRQGELLGLPWHDVDLKRHIAFLRDPERIKNKEPRAVPLSSRAVAALKALPRSIDGVVLPIERMTLYHAFLYACQRAGIADYTWHDLRHEALSRLAERGDLSVLEMAAVSGHKTLQMLKRYTHLRAEDLAKKLG